MKIKRGATLIEILVYASLIGVVLLGVYSTLIYCLKYYKAADTMVTLQENALTGIMNISNELIDSRAGTTNILISTSGTIGIAFPSPKGINNNAYIFNKDGQMGWQKWLCYYVEPQDNGTKNLVMKEIPVTPINYGSPGAIPYSTIDGFASASSANSSTNSIVRKTIARNVGNFLVTPDVALKTYNIQLTIDMTTDTTKPNTVTVNMDVMPRN
jgi:hypothetical protein